ncbi:hypothetical protein B0H16DRAFT_1460545 [Mycena metata]|uniref:Uncharacterized protein n=1 Tax=Mycena metata TaxID=1033252 RepID=A0AAD7IWL9_9AGAR|nr:hypothetical protein B0H16DRAFT_1460545 [Mycena metata]
MIPSCYRLPQATIVELMQLIRSSKASQGPGRLTQSQIQRELLRTRHECASEPEQWRVAAMRRGLGALTFRAFKTWNVDSTASVLFTLARSGCRARTGSAAACSARRARIGLQAGVSSGLLFIQFQRAGTYHIFLMLDIPPTFDVPSTLYILLFSLHINIDWYLLYQGGTGGAGGQSHTQGGLGGPGEGPIVNFGHGYIEINHGIKKEGMNTSGLLHRGHSRIWSPK